MIALLVRTTVCTTVVELEDTSSFRGAGYTRRYLPIYSASKWSSTPLNCPVENDVYEAVFGQSKPGCRASSRDPTRQNFGLEAMATQPLTNGVPLRTQDHTGASRRARALDTLLLRRAEWALGRVRRVRDRRSWSAVYEIRQDSRLNPDRDDGRVSRGRRDRDWRRQARLQRKLQGISPNLFYAVHGNGSFQWTKLDSDMALRHCARATHTRDVSGVHQRFRA